jgi:hypothetical protein
MAPYQCVIEDGESGSRHVIILAAEVDSAALLEAAEIWRRFCPSWCRSVGVWRDGEILATHGGPGPAPTRLNTIMP